MVFRTFCLHVGLSVSRLAFAVVNGFRMYKSLRITGFVCAQTVALALSVACGIAVRRVVSSASVMWLFHACFCSSCRIARCYRRFVAVSVFCFRRAVCRFHHYCRRYGIRGCVGLFSSCLGCLPLVVFRSIVRCSVVSILYFVDAVVPFHSIRFRLKRYFEVLCV